MNMNFLGYIFAGLVAVFPMLWIDNYTVKNPIWWTVVLAWHLGTLFGLIKGGNKR